MNTERILKYWNRITFFQIILSVIFFTIIRVILELVYLKCSFNSFQLFARLFLENISYFIILSIVLAAFISRLSKRPFIEVLRFGLGFCLIVLLPPLIDHYVFHRVAGYDYGTTKNYLENILTLTFTSGEASRGIAIEILLVLIAMSAFVWYFTRSLRKTVIAWFGSSFFIITLSTPSLMLGEKINFFVPYFLPIYYFTPLLIGCSIALEKYRPGSLIRILKNIRPIPSIAFVLTTFTGYLAAKHLGGKEDFSLLILASVSVFFSWLFAVFINDIFDKPIDMISNPQRPLPQGFFSIREYLLISSFFAIYAISFSAIINIYTATGIIIWLILGILYSVPPLRLRLNLSGHLVIGISFALSFCIGFFSIIPSVSLLLNQVNLPFISILILSGTLIPLAKDIKDEMADRKAGIKNLFTIFGSTTGRLITTLIISLSLAYPIFVVALDLREKMACLIISALASYFYLRNGNYLVTYFFTIVNILILFFSVYR